MCSTDDLKSHHKYWLTENGSGPVQSFLGKRTTGKQVELRGITVVRMADDRITEFWKQDNSYTTPRQLGIAEPDA